VARNECTLSSDIGFNELLESQSPGVELSKRLKTLIREQELNLGIAVAVYAILWGTGQKTEIAPVLIYSFVLGNFVVSFQKIVAPVVNRAPFPLSLLFCLLLIYIATPLVVMLATALVVAITQPSLPFLAYLRSGWKFPTVVTLVATTAYVVYVYFTAKLEQRNLELQKAVASERAQRDLALTELERAREVQQGLLPRTLPTVPGFQIASHFEPARVVGGDYFDIIKLSDSKLGVCIADVAGKSISAALLMANVQATVRAFASDVASPAWVCSRVNAVLCNNIARGKFVTFFYGVLDSGLHRFHYCSAGHVPPILVRADGRSEPLECQGAVLGVFPDWKYSDSLVQLEPGDRLVLFTDGASEACTPEGDEYGEERIAAAAARAVRMSGERILQSLITEVKAFCRFHLDDDLTLIVIAAD
jgi:sigma-B regulation protein RsbU (phosphoserine phosphatase)